MSTATSSRRKLCRVACGNRQVIHQHCGYGIGKTKAEAIADAIERLGGESTDARYDKQTDMVWFNGGCLL